MLPFSCSGSSKTKVCSGEPSAIRSCERSRVDVTGRSLTNVPWRLPISRSTYPSPSRSITAWARETCGFVSGRSLSTERPRVNGNRCIRMGAGTGEEKVGTPEWVAGEGRGMSRAGFLGASISQSVNREGPGKKQAAQRGGNFLGTGMVSPASRRLKQPQRIFMRRQSYRARHARRIYGPGPTATICCTASSTQQPRCP